ncbi:hypothetical protein GP486_006692 [Trichoglossum hirsutum]|uniref:Uncharacterized protein n=1 Tax=Trichoglossum hirsutum TaxID=265104 RepID=A0A9P8L7B3_9PEZI|nr:hypothetical protein GP486_006692 [Trichoglossum hirsutum]
MEVNREYSPDAEHVQLESKESVNCAGSCDATEAASPAPRCPSAGDVDPPDKSAELDRGICTGEAVPAIQETSELAGVDVLQQAITAAAESRMISSMASHDNPLRHTLMPNIGGHGDYDLAPTTPFRNRHGEEPSAPPLALHSTPSLSVPVSDAMVVDSPFLDTSPAHQEPIEAPRIQAFAKLEFDDGQFYMNTYSVILGRDIRAARAAYQREQQERESTKDPMRGGQSTSGGDASQTAALRAKRGGSAKMNSSVVSESGGIIGADDSDGKNRRKRSKKGSRKSKSTSSSSRQISRKNSIVQPSGHTTTDYQALAQPSRSDGAHPVDPSSLLPSPEECPLIPIHPPAAATRTGSHKGISRKHAKIAYNFDTHIFEVEIKGKNGAFVDDQWYAPGDVRPLKSGSFIQIGGVGIRFLLPEVVVGQGEVEEERGYNNDINFAFGGDGGVEMSSDIDGGNDDDDDDDDDDDQGIESGDEDDQDEAGEEDEEDEEDEDEDEEVEEPPSPEPLPQPPPPPPPPPPARRGPGRPPKNGISKRERQLAEKEAKEKAKAKLKGNKTAPPVTKNKVGRPRKNPLPETPPPKPEKRKYTRRKGLDDTSSPTKTKKDKESKEPKPPKEKKEKRPPKPPRSPSPVFDEANLTPEQLAKPQASYVILIHEALTNSKTGAMSLPQIYRAIERKYPFYKLRVQTTGWQSSVRHNLSQHHAFRKVERDGKGWLWGIVPGVSIEKERRKRPSPPPLHYQQPLQQQQQPIGLGMPQMHHQPMVSAPPPPPPPPLGLGKGLPGSFTHQIPPNGSAGVGSASSGMPHLSPRAGPPGGINAISPPNAASQGAAGSSGPISQRQQAPPSYSGKTASPAFHPMQENRPAQGVLLAPANRPPPPPPLPPHSTTGPTPPLPPQNQTRGIKLNDKTLQAIASFQTALVAKLTANGSKDAEAIVQSAVNRALGITDKSSVPGKEDPQEIAIMKAVSGMLNQINNKPLTHSSSPPNAVSGGAENKHTISRPHHHQQQQQQQQQQVRAASRPGGPVQQSPQVQGGRQVPSQHAVQAQLIHILSTALNKGGQKRISPQPGARPPSAGNPSVVGGGGGNGGNGGGALTRTNGTAAAGDSRPLFSTAPPPPPPPSTARTTETTISMNSDKSPTITAKQQQQQQPATTTTTTTPIAGVKRPLENGDGGSAEGQPEVKKVAVDDGAIATAGDGGGV